MKKINFGQTVGLLATWLIVGQSWAASPNIILIVADDLGYPDICAYGCVSGRTPHIDSIAANGIKFTDGYVSAPICSPSRAGMLTGRYQQRFGHEFNAGGAQRSHRLGLGTPTTEVMLPAYLKTAGYVTGMVGKWHLGSIDELHPMARGFDEFFGFLHGANGYFGSNPDMDKVQHTNTDEELQGRPPINPILRGHEPVQEDEYLTDAFSREAVAFIDRHADETFFLYLPYNAPHLPHEVTSEYYDRFPEIEDHAVRVYKAMISAVDDGVGRVLAALQEYGIADNTLVIFISDNGCAINARRACTNKPLFDGKLLPFEGGVRVPFLAQWPDALPAGRTLDIPVSTLDIVPTALDIGEVAVAQTTREQLDGVNFVDLVNEPDTRTDRDLFWRNQDNSGVRSGQWKLVVLNGHEMLFNLADDLGETNNLIDVRPEIAARMKRAFGTWEDATRTPLWPPRNISKRPVDLPGIGNRIIDTAI